MDLNALLDKIKDDITAALADGGTDTPTPPAPVDNSEALDLVAQAQGALDALAVVLAQPAAPASGDSTGDGASSDAGNTEHPEVVGQPAPA